MENKFTVDYFIKKFEAIPESMMISFCQGTTEPEPKSPHCALGWCLNSTGNYGCAIDGKNSNSTEALSLAKILSPLKKDVHQLRDMPNVAQINNGEHPSYPQPTPKQLILAALYDIKAMQPKEQDAPEKPQEIRYVTVKIDEQVEKLTKELILN
jgi:hypothetical protein